MTTTHDDLRPESARRTARRGERGFSFIEILIVMAIIGVLAAGITVAINIWLKRGPEFATKQTLSKTKLMIENWKQTFEMYPPSDVTRIAAVAGQGNKASSPENKVNMGIEAIYQALYWPGFKSDPEWGPDELSNVDEDTLKKAINKHGTTELMEIRDAWGNPLVYFHRDDYAVAFDSGVPYMDGNFNEYEAKPYKNDDGTFVNPSSFQIYSVGEDGEPNTEDDVKVWEQ